VTGSGTVRHFAKIDALAAGADPPRFSGNVMTRLMDHSWPRNVRELRSVGAVPFSITNGFTLVIQ